MILCVIASFAIILLWDGLQSVIVAFRGHTNLQLILLSSAKICYWPLMETNAIILILEET